MITIDLVTGYLGAGKTTFIQKYARYLLSQGLHIGIIENDFGAVNVDMMLLQELEGDSCDIEQIVGGNTCCEWKRRFKTKLIAMAMQGFDRIIVEPSGIYDVDEFFDVLYEEPVDQWYEIGNVFAIVNAKLDHRLSEPAQYLLASQVANAGKIVLSNIEDATEEDVAHTIQHIQDCMDKFHCSRQFETDIFKKSWSALTEQDFCELSQCGVVRSDWEKLWFDQNEAFTSLNFLNVRMTKQELCNRIGQLMKDERCGEIFRVKGFLPVEDGWLEINATHEQIKTGPVLNGQETIIVIGQNLQEDAIAPYFNK